MRPIPTTSGPLDLPAGARVLGHEHARTISESMLHQFPDSFDTNEMLDRACAALSGLAEHRVAAICDPTVLGLGRDARFNAALTERTGIAFILATGVYCTAFRYLPGYLSARGIDDVADLFVADVTKGIQGTGHRAGFIKVACDAPGMTHDVELAHRAAARASLRTGAPVMVHTSASAQSAVIALDVLGAEGLPASAVQIAHAGDSADINYLRGLLERGVCLGMDRFGLDHLLDRETRCEVVAQLCREGWGARLILSQDYCALPGWIEPQTPRQRWPDWSHHLIFEDAIPRLSALGVGPGLLEAMVGDNVVRWLANHSEG